MAPDVSTNRPTQAHGASLTHSRCILPARAPTTLEIDLDAAADNVRVVRQMVGPAAEDLRRGQGRRLRPRRRRAGRGLRRARRRRAGAWPTSARVSGSASAGSPRPSSSIRTRCPRPRRRRSPTASPRPWSISTARGPTRRPRTEPCDVFVKIDVGLERLGVPAEQAVKTDRGHAGAAAPAAGRALRPSARATAPIPPTPTGSSAASPPSSTSWRRAASAYPSGSSPPRRSCCASRRRISTPSIPAGCSTASRSPARRRRCRSARRSARSASRVIALKELTPRERFAELAPFPVTAPMRLGVIPDGPGRRPRLAARRARARTRARRCPSSPARSSSTRGSTSPTCPDARVGDEVVIIGRQGDAEITIAEVAKRHGLGLHHVATTVGPRVTRVYLRRRALSPA